MIAVEHELKSMLDEISFYIAKIESISFEQFRVLKEGDSSQLNILLDRKEELIKRVNESYLLISSKLEREKDNLREYKDECFSKIKGIENDLQKIIRNEHECLRKTMQIKDAVFDEIKQIANGKRVIHSYRNDNVDKKFEKNWQG